MMRTIACLILLPTLLLLSAPAVGQEPAKKTDPDKQSAPKDKAKQKSKSLDDELFKDLTGDLFEGLGDDPFKKKAQKQPGEKAGERPTGDHPLDQVSGEDIGEEKNPLMSLGRRMREVEQRIADARADKSTQSLQEEIVTALERLIEQARRQQQQQQNSSSSQSSPQQTANRNKVKQPGQSGSPRQGNRQENNRPNESTERQGPRKVKEVDMGQLNDLAKALWGHLPERVRQQMQQSPLDHFLPQYELLIEDYFKRLAKRYEDRP